LQLYYESYFNSKKAIFGPILKIIFIKHTEELLQIEIEFQNDFINEAELIKKVAKSVKKYQLKFSESAQKDTDLIPESLSPYRSRN
jgi:uncharacterized membrane-anchored protein YhcB (DUF1043 family)